MRTNTYAGQDWSGPGGTVNRDPETGIRYGIIPSHDVSHWALETIYDDGRDLDYEAYIEEVKSQLLATIEHIRDIKATESTSDNLCEELLEKALSDFLRHRDIAGTVMEFINDIVSDEPVETIVEKLFEAISDQIGDNYQGTGDCTRMGYEDDGYGLQIDGSGDLWVFKSPYFTYARYCSPCAPGACYLQNPLEGVVESNKCYCLGFNWFDKDQPCPYPVYSVETGKQI